MVAAIIGSERGNAMSGQLLCCDAHSILPAVYSSVGGSVMWAFETISVRTQLPRVPLSRRQGA